MEKTFLQEKNIMTHYFKNSRNPSFNGKDISTEKTLDNWEDVIECRNPSFNGKDIST